MKLIKPNENDAAKSVEIENQNKVQLQIDNFSYDLPEGRIAKYPLSERDLSKLAIFKDGIISEDIYKNIHEYIPENSLLIFNNTKVIHARIHFRNSTGGRIEIFCLEPADDSELAFAMSQIKSSRWKCLVGRVNKWKEKVIQAKFGSVSIQAEVISKTNDFFIIEFRWEPEPFSFAEVLEIAGEMPIPPYLNRDSEKIDIERYQTIYSTEEGSVAAPTAGLHFTNRIFEKFELKNISDEYVTLHVGAGTFKPVKSKIIQDHVMHSEWIEVNRSTIEKLISSFDRNQPKKVIPVGTTSLRTVETLYWMGVKAGQLKNPLIEDLEIKQWDAYNLRDDLSPLLSLSVLLKRMNELQIEKLICKTQILIAPPYKLKIAKGLITNFHQPNSTLLLLIASIVGEKWKDIYDYALKNNFRFLSYGDGCLLFADLASRNFNQ